VVTRVLLHKRAMKKEVPVNGKNIRTATKRRLGCEEERDVNNVNPKEAVPVQKGGAVWRTRGNQRV